MASHVGRASTRHCALDNQAREQILLGQLMVIFGRAGGVLTPTALFDVGIDAQVHFKDANGNASGKLIYLQLKSGPSHLRLRKSDGKLVYRVKKRFHLVQWSNTPADVYLVVQPTLKRILWMNISQQLRQHPDQDSQVIPFDGIRLDLRSIRSLRASLLRKSSS